MISSAFSFADLEILNGFVCEYISTLLLGLLAPNASILPSMVTANIFPLAAIILPISPLTSFIHAIDAPSFESWIDVMLFLPPA